MQTKAAFTRAYNKESHMTPYSTGILSKKHNRSAQVSDNFFNEEDAADNQEEDDNTDNIEIDTMIKVYLRWILSVFIMSFKLNFTCSIYYFITSLEVKD